MYMGYSALSLQSQELSGSIYLAIAFHFHSGFPTSILADHTSILELHVFILRMRV